MSMALEGPMTSDEAEIERRAEAWQQAIQQRDAGAAAEFLADDFALVIVQPKRAVLPRAQWLALLADYVTTEYEIDEWIVDVDGDLAVVLQRVRMEATVLGADRSGAFILTDVWRREGARWRVWRRHSTPVSAGPMPTST